MTPIDLVLEGICTLTQAQELVAVGAVARKNKRVEAEELERMRLLTVNPAVPIQDNFAGDNYTSQVRKR